MPSFEGLVLQTPRLRLRPLQPADAQPLFEIFSDPTVMRYWSTPPWTSLAPALEMLQRDREAMPTGEHLRLGLERRSDGRLVGMCTLFSFRNRRAEMGYTQGLPYWGQGYVSEALRALLGYAFEELQLRRIEADVDPRNTASVRILERLGFVCEGLLRERWVVGDEVSDSALYGLIKRDWRP